jgi:hypothetical protein
MRGRLKPLQTALSTAVAVHHSCGVAPLGGYCHGLVVTRETMQTVALLSAVPTLLGHYPVRATVGTLCDHRHTLFQKAESVCFPADRTW